MVALKQDSKRIRDFLSSLAEEDWLRRTERRWWPRFVYHYADIRNAVRILQDGHLYSRQHLENTHRLAVNSGSPIVLVGTDAAIKDCVRLYFRPRTPTQYHVEGICSKDTLSQSRFPGAHCPVPVFFLFDSAEILTRADCLFSDKGLGAHSYRLLSTAIELKQLPWRKIYHTGWLYPSSPTGRDIIARRNAEVIVPKKLELDSLRYIYCRSDAERETLLYLLTPSLRERYQNKIVATARSDLYFRKQTFIESVRLSSTGVYVQFSPETGSPGPFHLHAELKTASSRGVFEMRDFDLVKSHKLRIWKKGLQANSYTVTITLDDHLAYANAYEEIEIPF